MSDWRDLSKCRDQDPDIFFAARGRQAKDVLAGCRGCPVKKECLAFAVESPWRPFGVWGGLPMSKVRTMWADTHQPRERAERQELLGLRKDRSTP